MDIDGEIKKELHLAATACHNPHCEIDRDLL
jgi:hypothetical protein